MPEQSNPTEGRNDKPAVSVDPNKIAEAARRDELNRIRDIEALGEAHNMADFAREHVAKGTALDAFRKIMLEKIGEAKPAAVADPHIGLTPTEARGFSFLKVIRACMDPTNKRAQEAAGFELECSAAVAERMGREPRGFYVPDSVDGHIDQRAIDEIGRVQVPMDVLTQALRGVLKRDLNTGTPSEGGDLVATDLLAQNFIDLLRNRTVVFAASTQLTGLVGDVAIPRQTGPAQAFWVAEGDSPTESQQAVDQVTLNPKTVGAFTDYTRKLMLQSSISVEAFVRSDLAAILGLAIDLAGIDGSGTGNEPRGILNTTGIGDVEGGTNGGAPTWGNIVDLETAVASGNADVGRLAYLTNAKVRGKLKQTEKAANTAQFVWDGTMMNGYNALVSNQVPADLTKGTGTNLSAILFGNWADLLYGLWGALDILVDPYTHSTSGTIRIVALQDVDTAVRHAESFAAMQDAITV